MEALPAAILVRAPNWVGDTVLSIPMLRALRARFPGATIGLTGPAAHLIAPGPWADRLLPTPQRWPFWLPWLVAIRRARFDVALILPNSFQSALAIRLAGIPRRIGYAGDGRAWLLTTALPRPKGLHQAEAYMGLLSPLGVVSSTLPPEYPIGDETEREAGLLWQRAGLGERPTVGIHLGAAFGPSKLWWPERYAELGSRLGAREPLDVVFFGSPQERGLWQIIERQLSRPISSLVGHDRLEILPALLRRCRVLVSGDTGAMHLAAAVGVRVVALFGPTDPRLTRPLGEGHTVIWKQVPCAPCFLPQCPIDHPCMGQISVDEVEAAVLRALTR